MLKRVNAHIDEDKQQTLGDLLFEAPCVYNCYGFVILTVWLVRS